MNPPTAPWHFLPFDDDRRDFTSYRFVMSHIAISGDDVHQDLDPDRKQWHLRQEEEDGRFWEVYGNSRFEAVLALIAARNGLRVTFTEIEDEESQP